MRLASVTSVSPTFVRRDGDRVPVPVVATTVSISVSDRVLVETLEHQVYIVTVLA